MNPNQPRLFERPLDRSRAVYPCSVDDLEAELKALPENDLCGLRTLGLVPATRKDCHANARYFYAPNATIHIYSYPFELAIKLEPGLTTGRLEDLYRTELEFGMEVVASGARRIGRWTLHDLRRFTLEHVLPHEIGHHVYHAQRRDRGFIHRPGTRESEQFADAYARRRARLRR